MTSYSYLNQIVLYYVLLTHSLQPLKHWRRRIGRVEMAKSTSTKRSPFPRASINQYRYRHVIYSCAVYRMDLW